MAKKSARWNSQSEDGQDLRKYIISGDITDDMTPKEVQDMFEQFRKYSNNCFADGLQFFSFYFVVFILRPIL